jgi:hypothetical protein
MKRYLQIYANGITISARAAQTRIWWVLAGRHIHSLGWARSEHDGFSPFLNSSLAIVLSDYCRVRLYQYRHERLAERGAR